MSWDNFHARLRWGGRDAAIFTAVVLAICFGIALVSATGLYKYADQFFAVLAVFIAIRLCVVAKKFRQNRAGRLKYRSSDAAALSRDELRKARSKLTGNKNINFPQRRY